ncbi:hypothetical protein P4234_20730 [Pseudomonas aeruginosa]|nr:hypothetical protein [Pseudomonas aeruginosa]
MSDVFDLGSMTTVATATGQYSFYTPPPPTPIPYLTYIARPGINKFDLPEGAKIKDLIKRYQYERSQVPAAIMIRGVQEEIKKSTNTALANVGSIVDGELAYLASQKKEKLNPTGATPLQMATAEKAAAVELLASKQKELADARTIANAFFGYDPLTVNYVNVMNEIYGRREDKDFSFDNWSKSYSAAQKIRLIEAEISVLNSRSSALDGKVAELTRLQRLEDAQRAAEAARQTEAERLAQEQRQLKPDGRPKRLVARPRLSNKPNCNAWPKQRPSESQRRRKSVKTKSMRGFRPLSYRKVRPSASRKSTSVWKNRTKSATPPSLHLPQSMPALGSMTHSPIPEPV